jgi:hypothetical protein
MHDNNNYGPSAFLSATTLLWFAVGLAVFFLGLLVFDFIQRKRWARHHRRPAPRESLRTKLLKPIKNVRAFQRELKQMLEENARRNRRRQRGPDA